MNHHKGNKEKQSHLQWHQKIPRNRFNQECKRAMPENYKTLKKEIEENTNT